MTSNILKTESKVSTKGITDSQANRSEKESIIRFLKLKEDFNLLAEPKTIKECEEKAEYYTDMIRFTSIYDLDNFVSLDSDENKYLVQALQHMAMHFFSKLEKLQNAEKIKQNTK
jgi:hypothetical protein